MSFLVFKCNEEKNNGFQVYIKNNLKSRLIIAGCYLRKNAYMITMISQLEQIFQKCHPSSSEK